jgi:hypothetical protein
MKTRPKGVALFGYLYLSVGIYTLVMSLIVILLMLLARSTDIIALSSALSGIIIGIVTLLCGIGLLRMRKWGLKLLVCSNIWAIAYGIYGLWSKINYPIQHNNIFLMINIVSIAVFVLIIRYFTCKNITSQFIK